MRMPHGQAHHPGTIRVIARQSLAVPADSHENYELDERNQQDSQDSTISALIGASLAKSSFFSISPTLK